MWLIPITWEPFTIKATVSASILPVISLELLLGMWHHSILPLYPHPYCSPYSPTPLAVQWANNTFTSLMPNSATCRRDGNLWYSVSCKWQYCEVNSAGRQSEWEVDFFLFHLVKVLISLLKLSSTEFSGCWSHQIQLAWLQNMRTGKDLPLSSVTASLPVSLNPSYFPPKIHLGLIQKQALL